MSHFTVLVIGDDWEEQLAPYDENRAVAPYREEVSESDIQRMKDYYEEKGEPIDSEEKLFDNWPKWSGRELYHENGNYFDHSTYNPDSRWDWYVMGGRWAGFFTLKEEHAGKGQLGGEGVFGYRDGIVDNDRRVDQALKGEIDWKSMAAEAKEKAEAAWEASEDANEAGRYFGYGREKEDTKESYLRRMSKPSTSAIVRDGIWYERGMVGSFATIIDPKMSHDEWEDKWQAILDDVADSTLLTLVDCHI